MSVVHASADPVTVDALYGAVEGAQLRLQCALDCFEDKCDEPDLAVRGAIGVVREVVDCLEVIAADAEQLSRSEYDNVHLLRGLRRRVEDYCKEGTDIDEIGCGPDPEENPKGRRDFLTQMFVNVAVQDALEAGRPIGRLCAEYGKVVYTEPCPTASE